MSVSRRPLLAAVTMQAIIVLQFVVDFEGDWLLANLAVHMPAAQPWWPVVRYAVYIPVALGLIWFAASKAGDRFCTMWLAGTWAVLLAQFATLLATTWDLLLAAYLSGLALAFAAPAGLVVALVTRFAGGAVDREAQIEQRRSIGRDPLAIPGVIVAAVLSLIPGGYWSLTALPVGPPAETLATGALQFLALGLCYWFGVAVMRRRVPCGLLGPWLGYLLGGLLFGALFFVLLLATSVASDLQSPFLMLHGAYVCLAEGASAAMLVGFIAAPLTWVLLRFARPAPSKNEG